MRDVGIDVFCLQTKQKDQKMSCGKMQIILRNLGVI